MNFEVGLVHYLILSAIIFLLALFGIIIVKNLIKILILIEVLFVSVSLNFISFANYFDVELSGMTFALFILGISAAQLAIGVAFLFALYKNKKNIDVDSIEELKG